jgi:Fur family peroxide stress response transcriptional regulator
MRKDLRENRLDFFKKRCRENGLKITPQRISIYQELAKCKQHPSTESVFRLTREKFPHISKDTVNRTLLAFSEIGLVDVVEAREGPRRYDPDLTPHHHFHCVSCNEIIDFQGKKYGEIAILEQIRKKYTVFSKRVVLTGLCEKCSKSPKAPK